jgi:hypothetical protein
MLGGSKQSSLVFAVFLSTLASMAGCQCQCGNVVVIGDGGQGGGTATDGGRTGGGTATGGGATTGGGTATGGGTGVDAGDITVGLGPGPGTFTLDGGVGGVGTGVALDPSGGIVLGQGGGVDQPFMWIANDSEGWVSKYDTRTGKELGRYWSVFPKNCANSAGPPCAGGVANGLSAAATNHPSRTAIDLNGDLWVANRAIGTQGSVTKIASDPSRCIDRNGNGVIETSRDLDHNGQISGAEFITPTNFADPLQYDECVLFSTAVGGPVPTGDVGGRALAVAAGIEGGGPGEIWVGIFHEAKLYKLNGTTGQVMPVNAAGATSVQLGFGPYGAIVDRLQRVWVVSATSGMLALVDATTGAVLAAGLDGHGAAGCMSYGIGIDGKNRVWLGGWSSGPKACRYDHSTGTWTQFDFSGARSQTGSAFAWGRGIAVDTSGAVYMSGYAGDKAQLIRFDSEDGGVIPFGAAQFIDASDTNTAGSIGVGLDFDGNPWVNNSSGNAMRIDRMTGAVLRTPQQAAGLYTYSDFTGYQLRNYTAPRGVWSKDFTGCSPTTQWKTLTWDATAPANTRLQVFVRAGDTIADLSDVSIPRYQLMTSPADLLLAGVPRKLYLRVFFELSNADGRSTPVVRSMNLQWGCASDIN